MVSGLRAPARFRSRLIRTADAAAPAAAETGRSFIAAGALSRVHAQIDLLIGERRAALRNRGGDGAQCILDLRLVVGRRVFTTRRLRRITRRSAEATRAAAA